MPRPYNFISAADGLGFGRLGFNDLTENRSFGGSGRALGALEPSKKVGGEAPHLLDDFKASRGRPDPKNDRLSVNSVNLNRLNPNPLVADQRASMGMSFADTGTSWWWESDHCVDGPVSNLLRVAVTGL